MIPYEGTHRTLPNGDTISLYRQLFNWRVCISTPEDWPDFITDDW